MRYHYVKKTPRILILLLLFATLPVLKPAFAFAETEKPKGPIQSEWPEMDFTDAYDNFAKKDFSHAALEIRKGADFLKAASERAEGKIKKDLLCSYDELERLSDDMEKGAVTSSVRLREAFSHAHQSLAEYYHARLKNSWLKRDTDNAGRELKSTVSNLERSISWAGGMVDEKTTTVIREAQSLGDKLSEKAEWTAEEVEKGIKVVGEELKKLEGKSPEDK